MNTQKSLLGIVLEHGGIRKTLVNKKELRSWLIQNEVQGDVEDILEKVESHQHYSIECNGLKLITELR